MIETTDPLASFIPNREGQDLQASFSLLHDDGSPSTPSSRTKRRPANGELHFQKSESECSEYRLDLFLTCKQPRKRTGLSRSSCARSCLIRAYPNLHRPHCRRIIPDMRPLAMIRPAKELLPRTRHQQLYLLQAALHQRRTRTSSRTCHHATSSMHLASRLRRGPQAVEEGPISMFGQICIACLLCDRIVSSYC
jgi:hypothetical protein